MHAQLITGFFQYEPCELYIKDGNLCFVAAGFNKTFGKNELTSASLSRPKNGQCRIELSTENEQFEFLLSGKRSDEEITNLLYELTKNNGRLEIRMSSEKE